MTHDEFRALYRLDERLAEGQVVTHRAREMDGDPVLVHFLVEDRPGSRTSLLNFLPKLDSAHAAQIRLLTEVDDVPVLVTDPLQGFTSLVDWLDEATHQGRKTDDPGILTRILATAPPTGTVEPPPVVEEPEAETGSDEDDAPTSLRLGETRLYQPGGETAAAGEADEAPPEKDAPEPEDDEFDQTRLLTPDQVGQALDKADEPATPDPEKAPGPGAPGKGKGPGRPGAYTMVFGDSGGRIKTGSVEPPRPEPPKAGRPKPAPPGVEPSKQTPPKAQAAKKVLSPPPRPPARKEPASKVMPILGAVAAVLILVIIVVVVLNMMG